MYYYSAILTFNNGSEVKMHCDCFKHYIKLTMHKILNKIKIYNLTICL